MESKQWKSNIAAAILALIAILYIFAPPGLFIGILIVVPLVLLSGIAWTTDIFRDKDD